MNAKNKIIFFLEFSHRIFVYFLINAASFYQKTLSPLWGRHCRFYPSCSQYFILAVQKKGLFKGMALTVWRLLRCNPFCRGGLDEIK